MKTSLFYTTALAILITIVLSACTPQTPATPTVDIIGTTSALLAADMQTQTAGAVTPTPPPPTATEIPVFTATPEGPPTDKPAPKPAAVIAVAGCWTGPGDSYTLISNIEPNANGRKNIIILGTGSEPGWYVIRNPYFNNPCWIREENLAIDPIMDMNQFPVMTPGP